MPSMQPDLFAAPGPPLPEGFRYRGEVITPAEEQALAAWLAGLPFRPFEFRGYAARREVVSFGWGYDSSRTRLLPAQAIPPELAPLRAQAAELAEVAPEALQQVLINRYPPGAPIGWHRDRPMFGRVAGISLLAPARLRFRRRTANGFERAEQALAPRSAYALTGPARELWEHSIPEQPELRYSITFRTFREG